MVCALLHNRCVDRWIKSNRPNGGMTSQQQQWDAAAFNPDIAVLQNHAVHDALPSDVTVMGMMHNHFVVDLPRATGDHTGGDRRANLRDYIRSLGIVYDHKTDTDFHHIDRP